MMMMMICRAGPVIDVGGSDVVRFSDSLAFGASGLGNLMTVMMVMKMTMMMVFSSSSK